MRKKQVKGEIPTARNLLNSTYLNDLVQQNDGYRFLKHSPASPAFWQQHNKKMLSTIRQLGTPTLFVFRYIISC